MGARINVVGEWNLETSLSYGRDTERSTSQYGINNAALTAALARTDPATALNPFSAAPNNAAALPGARQSVVHRARRYALPGLGTQVRRSADVAAGRRAARGHRLRRPAAHQPVRPDHAAPGKRRCVAITPEVRRNVKSAYRRSAGAVVRRRERAPRPARARARPGGALRTTTAISTDGSTVNPKYGLDWAPMDKLKFRGTYGESFRAPTFAQIYGNSSSLFVQNYSDPTRGGAITQGVTLSGGNLRARARDRQRRTPSAWTSTPKRWRSRQPHVLPHRVRKADHVLSVRPDDPQSREPVRRHRHHRAQSGSGVHRESGGHQADSRRAAESRDAVRRRPHQQPRHDRSPRAST